MNSRAFSVNQAKNKIETFFSQNKNPSEIFYDRKADLKEIGKNEEKNDNISFKQLVSKTDNSNLHSNPIERKEFAALKFQKATSFNMPDRKIEIEENPFTDDFDLADIDIDFENSCLEARVNL